MRLTNAVRVPVFATLECTQLETQQKVTFHTRHIMLVRAGNTQEQAKTQAINLVAPILSGKFFRFCEDNQCSAAGFVVSDIRLHSPS